MENKTKKINWLRYGICSGVLCLLAVLLFSLYKDKALGIITDLSADGKMPNLVWLAENVFVAVPVWILVIVSEFFYFNKEKYVPVYTQIEKLLIFSTAAAFTFFLMLPAVRYASQGGIETEEVIETLWDKTYMWFFAQIIPYIIIIVYHAARIGTEKKELSGEMEPECDIGDAADCDEANEEAESENACDEEINNENKI